MKTVNQISLKAYSDILNTSKTLNIPYSFNGATEDCNNSIYKRFKTVKNYNEEGELKSVKLTSYYGNSTSYVTPGLVKIYMNGSLVRSLYRDELKNNVSISVPVNFMQDKATMSIVLYNIYGETIVDTINHYYSK